jgi:streptogramin lyase
MLLIGAGVAPALAAETSFTFTTLAGTSGAIVNSADGTGSAAQFSAPRGVAVDSAGNVYVADGSNHTIRKVTALGVVTTYAGTAGSTGIVSVAPARFSEPFGVATDSAGNVYVADTNNNAIRKITPTGTVTTLAGGNGMGTTDGPGTSAKFSEPHDVALDSSGNIYVTDYMNHSVRKITPAGVVSTLAGSAGNSGFTNGSGTAATFKSLQGITVDSAGNIYVSDAGNHAIRKITPSGTVTTVAGGTAESFGEPRGIAVDAAGNLYVADSNAIKKVTAAGAISIYAGSPSTKGTSDGTTTTARFSAPWGVAVDSANNVYVGDTLNNSVRKITPGGTVTTLAGLAGRSSSVDGKGTAARFEDPYAVATDGTYVYVADATDHSIRKIAADGTVTTLAGKAGTFGSTDGSGTAALFNGPQGITADTAGNVYVADTGNSTVRKITAAGVVTTLAGSAGQGGSTDGTGAAARFSSPYGIAVDSAGTVYVVDSNDNTLRKITPAGVVTTLAGSPGAIGLTDGTGNAARFSVPFDVAVDGAGNIYVCDHGNSAIRKITPAGVVTTLAGSGSQGNTDGKGSAATFKFPAGIAADSSGNVYVADTDNQIIRRITPSGDVTTIAGSTVGSVDGVGTAASFYNPKDVAVDSSGNLYVADRGNHTIRKGTLGTTTGGSASSTPEQVTADCVFDWAEANYKDYFSPAVKSATSEPFYYRLYSGKQTAIGVASSNLHVYLGGQLTNLGPIGNFLTMSGCK